MQGQGIGRRLALALAGATLAAPARAQGRYPDRPIRVFVPFPPGGTTDIQMRSLCEGASRRIGQPIVIENRPGAGGSMGATALAQGTRPDGYTLSVMPNSIFRIPVMMARPPYDPMADFTWIIRLVGYTFGIVVRADAPWKSIQELLADAKARPGVISYGNVGAASANRIAGQQLASAAGGEFNLVPYQGGADDMTSLLGGHLDVYGDPGVGPVALSGKIRVLATLTDQRLKPWW